MPLKVLGVFIIAVFNFCESLYTWYRSHGDGQNNSLLWENCLMCDWNVLYCFHSVIVLFYYIWHQSILWRAIWVIPPGWDPKCDMTCVSQKVSLILMSLFYMHLQIILLLTKFGGEQVCLNEDAAENVPVWYNFDAVSMLRQTGTFSVISEPRYTILTPNLVSY